MGFGTFPFGTKPFGFGTLASVQLPAGKPLTDPSTGTVTGSRSVDPRTGDYTIDANGRATGMDDIRQLVLLRIKTTVGTAGMQSLGNDLKSIDRITSNIQYRVESKLRAAVQDIVDLGLIEVVAVTVEQVRPGTIFTRFRWRAVATGIEDVETVPLTR